METESDVTKRLVLGFIDLSVEAAESEDVPV
jgi:hypothetical protein